jgi:hypothetical protein
MRTNINLYNEFSSSILWQSKKLIPVEDLSYVIPNLLKEKFVVEIDGHKYDLSFGFNAKENYIGQIWSSAPSPHLTSTDILNKAFKEGKWFIVQND